jgi:CheY-like chemotaxis protein
MFKYENSPAKRTMPKTVLIIEDDADIQAIFAKVLYSKGYSVLTATQGAEGVHLARKYRPEMILLDIRMPVMDGWGALRYLRSYTETREIPVCGISAMASSTALEGEDGVSFDHILKKPIDPVEVVRVVEGRIGPAD